MAHNLSSINGQVSYAYQGSTPWHGLGTRTTGITSVEQALQAAHLDWQVGLEPLFLADGRKVDDRKAVVRDKDRRVLGTVGPSFTPLQNADAFGVLNEACRDHGVTIESIGALGLGGRTFALAKLPETVTPTAGDDVRGYFLITNGHDGSLGYTARCTPIRVVCQNTLSVALRAGSGLISIRHTKSIGDRKHEVERLVNALVRNFKETGQTFAQLAEQRLTREQVIAFVERVLPADKQGEVTDTLARKRVIVHDLVYTGKGADLAGSDLRTGDSTPWAVYNAFTEYVDHVAPAERKSPSAVRSSLESAIFGAGNQLKLDALQAARELVAA